MSNFWRFLAECANKVDNHENGYNAKHSNAYKQKELICLLAFLDFHIILLDLFSQKRDLYVFLALLNPCIFKLVDSLLVNTCVR